MRLDTPSTLPLHETAGSALQGVVKDSVLGALLVIAVVLLVWLVRRVLEVQDLRVADQKQMSDRLEKAQERQAQLIGQMTEAFSAFKNAVSQLSTAQGAGKEATADLTTAIKSLQGTMDSVIREAVSTRRSGMSGGYAATPRGGTPIGRY